VKSWNDLMTLCETSPTRPDQRQARLTNGRQGVLQSQGAAVTDVYHAREATEPTVAEWLEAGDVEGARGACAGI